MKSLSTPQIVWILGDYLIRQFWQFISYQTYFLLIRFLPTFRISRNWQLLRLEIDDSFSRTRSQWTKVNWTKTEIFGVDSNDVYSRDDSLCHGSHYRNSTQIFSVTTKYLKRMSRSSDVRKKRLFDMKINRNAGSAWGGANMLKNVDFLISTVDWTILRIVQIHFRIRKDWQFGKSTFRLFWSYALLKVSKKLDLLPKWQLFVIVQKFSADRTKYLLFSMKSG